MNRIFTKLMIYFCGVGVLIIILLQVFKTESKPLEESTWLQYASPEEAGWSSYDLKKAKNYYHSIDSTSAMVIYDGKVLLSWGDVTKPTNAHSVRKSLLHALYGIHIENGTIELDQSLEDLQIDDFPKLTQNEKQATVKDLLTSRSGVFHKAGEESWTMKRRRPARESYRPGTYFYYNNWDFNVLGTILNEQTNSDLFEQFNEKVAIPIGMEDFDLQDTNYKYESNYSIHPSYLFKMSTRDMARFGQLYLQKGNWGNKQIVPRSWIERSTTVQTQVRGNSVYGYGYLWWVADSGMYKDLGLISAIGRYGQSIDIIPSLNLVFVHRVRSSDSPYAIVKRSVNQAQRIRLLSLILDAKISNPDLEQARVLPLKVEAK